MRFRWKIWTDYSERLPENNLSPEEQHRKIIELIDAQGFQGWIVFVAGVGFFMDAYMLFASNMIEPMLLYVYWPTDSTTPTAAPNHALIINAATLAGTLVGQVLFGVLGDIWGRRKMYGQELLVVMLGIIGVVMSSTGVRNMSMIAWVGVWRAVTGVGLGGDYPLSAVITSEWAPKTHRARMLASLFLSQSLGQLAANLVGLAVVAGRHPTTPSAVDSTWRWIAGVGGLPAVLAIAFRLTIPESPRYRLEFDPARALHETAVHMTGRRFSQQQQQGVNGHAAPGRHDERPAPLRRGSTASQEASTQDPSPWSQLQHTWDDIVDYFYHQGNWRTLFATCGCWALNDFAFYGLGLSNIQTVARLWGQGNTSAGWPLWNTSTTPLSADPSIIYTILFANAWHTLVLLSVGAILGSVALVTFVPKVNRKTLQWGMFLWLGCLFALTGAIMTAVQDAQTVREIYPLYLFLYVLIQASFNFGPNSTTYIIPAEVFPTRYRSTCHGLSAAAGKFGGLCAQLLTAYGTFGLSAPRRADTNMQQGITLLIFAGLMGVGAGLTFWLPELQVRDRRTGEWVSRSLEVLGRGRSPLAGGSERESLSSGFEMTGSARRSSAGRPSTGDSD